MKGDFSRVTYNRQKNYNRVLMQQGRVLLDADWNEQAAIYQEAMRLLSRDLFGAHGGPSDELGFKITVEGGDLTVGSGRYYVDGRMVENHSATKYSAQLGYPFDDSPKVDALKDTPWLAYLDIWENFVSYVQDDSLREVALGGPDTCGRAQTKWQVRVILGAKDAKDKDAVKSWGPTGSGRLSARAKPKAKSDELCVVSPDARYQGLENQLYRVEIHKGGTVGNGALYKWSRNNGAVIYPVVSATGTRMELEHLGKDKVTGLVEGGWVEYIDDELMARTGAGKLARVDKLDRNENAITLELPQGTTAMPVFVPTLHPLLRRWDHMGEFSMSDGAVPIKEERWTSLEDGIDIKFSEEGSRCRTGDYWLIPARVATGEIDWPRDPTDLKQAAAKLPDGPQHSYAPLLYVADLSKPEDRRCVCTVERQPPKP